MAIDWNWEQHRSGPNLEFSGYEYFTTMNAITALVRETIQNGWDAMRKNENTLVIRFRFGTAKKVDRDKYLGDQLWKHLHSGLVETGDPHGDLYASLRGEKPKGTPIWAEPLRYLAVEDFGTTGLDGDENETSPTATSKPTNLFRQFHHAWGESIGANNRGGSWGFGKAVIPYASKILTFWALSVRNETPDSKTTLGISLMGQSIIRNHFLPHVADQWKFWGYYGLMDGYSYLPLTAKSHTTQINHFKKAFEVSGRDLKEVDRGLSAIIPYPKDEITPKEIAKEAITNYVHLIQNGRLQVHVIDSDAGIDWNINDATIHQWLDQESSTYGELLGWEE
jgi:hypothetical protein